MACGQRVHQLVILSGSVAGVDGGRFRQRRFGFVAAAVSMQGNTSPNQLREVERSV